MLKRNSAGYQNNTKNTPTSPYWNQDTDENVKMSRTRQYLWIGLKNKGDLDFTKETL